MYITYRNYHLNTETCHGQSFDKSYELNFAEFWQAAGGAVCPEAPVHRAHPRLAEVRHKPGGEQNNF